MKKTAAAILSLLLMTGAVAGMADGAYTPGTYRQSAKGMGGDVVVDVTFDADAMTAIDVVSQNETAGLGDVALTSVAQAMLDAQSAQAGGFSGHRRGERQRAGRGAFCARRLHHDRAGQQRRGDGGNDVLRR